MILLLEHPQLAALPCEECQAWIYDIPSGEPKLRGGQKQRRSPSQPTPCGSCPKKSPENAREITLDAKNHRTLRLYLRNRALWGRALTEEEAADAIIQRNFGLLDLLLRKYERSQAALEIASAALAKHG